MGDNMTLDQLKTQYRIRFYRDGSKDLPEFRPGSNVLSAIKDYFQDTSGEESPGNGSSFFADSETNVNIPGSMMTRGKKRTSSSSSSSSKKPRSSKLNRLRSTGGEESPINGSFFADSETNVNIPGSMMTRGKKRTSSSSSSSSKKPRSSKLNRLRSTGEINETNMKATTSSAANEKLKMTHFNNFEEEVDDCESDMPLNLVVERDKETEIVRSVRSVSRERIYSLDSSVVQGSPSPTSKSSPQKRLRFSDAVGKERESFASIFSNRYKSAPAEDVQTMQMDESVSYAGNKSAPYVARVGEYEFVIEDEDTINMCFSSNKISSLEGSKEERSAASSSTHGNQKLEAEASEVISGQSPSSQNKRRSQTKRNGSNVSNKSTTRKGKTILSRDGPEETKRTPSSGLDNGKQKICSPGTRRNQKREAQASEVISGQSPSSQNKRCSQTKRNGSNVSNKSTTGKGKTILSREGPEETKRTPSSATCEGQAFSTKFNSLLAQSLAYSKSIRNSERTRQRKKVLEMAEEENVDMISDTNSEKIQIPRKSKVESSKSSVSHQEEVEIEPTKTVFEESSIQSQAVGNALKDDKINKTKYSLCSDNSFASRIARFANCKPPIARIDISDLPVTDEDEFVIHDDADFENDPKSCKKNVACEMFNSTFTKEIKSDDATDSRKSNNDGRASSSPLTVSHQMEVEIEPTKTVSKQSIVQSQTVRNTFKDDKTYKWKDSLCKDTNSFASQLARIVNIQPPLTRMDDTDLPVVDEDEFVIHETTYLEIDPKSSKKKTKNPNDSKKNKETGKNAEREVLNVTYTSARTSDNNATDLRKSHNDERDSSSPSGKKKSRPTELDRLVLHTYLPADVDNQSESISLRPKRASAPPYAWWIVTQAERNSTFDVDLPQSSPKSTRKASADSKEPSESKKEDIFEVKESGPLDQTEEKTLIESDEKSSKTLKRAKKTKHVESEETTAPSKVKIPRNQNNCKITQTTPRKTNKSTKLQKQLGQEIQEVDTQGPQENDLNVIDLSNKADSFSRAPISESPTMREPQCPSPWKDKPVLDESSTKSPASGSRIQYKYLKNWKHTKERELHPRDGLPLQSYTSPPNHSAKLSFQSGPALKTRAVRHNNQMDSVARKLSTAESPNTMDRTPSTIVFDPETDCDVLSHCVQNTSECNPSLSLRCFNNSIFSAGKIMLKPTEEEMRDTPMFDILVFYVARGSIVLKLHKSKYALESGDFFYIPPCNTYRIQNRGSEVVELVFTQLKTKAK